MSVIQQLTAVQAQIEERKAAVAGEAGREYALANTALEDAMMRFNRGLAKELGIFEIADLEVGTET